MNMFEQDPKIGDIFWASKNSFWEGKHPIVYLGGRSDVDFVGAMLTRASSHRNIENIKMSARHFITGYDNSHLVKQRFIKPFSWGEFDKFGRLSGEGIALVMHEMGDLPEISFVDYYRITFESN